MVLFIHSFEYQVNCSSGYSISIYIGLMLIRDRRIISDGIYQKIVFAERAPNALEMMLFSELIMLKNL